MKWSANGSRSPARSRTRRSLDRRLRALPHVRYLEAPAGPPTRAVARRNGHRAGRRDGRHLRALVLYLAGWNNSISKSFIWHFVKQRNGPQISEVFPNAAIPGGEFQIRGKGLAGAGPSSRQVRRTPRARRHRLRFLRDRARARGAPAGEHARSATSAAPGPATSASWSPTACIPSPIRWSTATAISTRPSADRPARKLPCRFIRSTRIITRQALWSPI